MRQGLTDSVASMEVSFIKYQQRRDENNRPFQVAAYLPVAFAPVLRKRLSLSPCVFRRGEGGGNAISVLKCAFVMKECFRW